MWSSSLLGGLVVCEATLGIFGCAQDAVENVFVQLICVDQAVATDISVSNRLQACKSFRIAPALEQMGKATLKPLNAHPTHQRSY